MCECFQGVSEGQIEWYKLVRKAEDVALATAGFEGSTNAIGRWEIGIISLLCSIPVFLKTEDPKVGSKFKMDSLTCVYGILSHGATGFSV